MDPTRRENALRRVAPAIVERPSQDVVTAAGHDRRAGGREPAPGPYGRVTRAPGWPTRLVRPCRGRRESPRRPTALVPARAAQSPARPLERERNRARRGAPRSAG